MAFSAISQLDARILSHVSREGISSVREIASKLRISPSTLAYRLRRLEQGRIIQDYRYRADFSMLGLGQEAWVFLDISHKGINTSSLLDELILRPEVHIALVLTGDFDIALKVYCRGVDEVLHFVMALEHDLRHAINSTSTCLVANRLKAHNKILNPKKKKYPFTRTDFRLLSYRMENPKAKLSEAASALKLHRNTVAGRWRKLFESGIVLKKTAIISPEHHPAAGMGFASMLFFDATPGNKKALATALLQMGEIHELSLVVFPHDLLAIVRTSDIGAYYEFHKRFFPPSEINPLIRDIKSFVIMHSKSHPPNYLSELGEEAVLSGLKRQPG